MTTVTPEMLKALIIKGDRGALCETLAPLSEAERQALADDALRMARAVDRGWGPSKSANAQEHQEGKGGSLLKALAAQKYPDWRCPRWTASLMVAALCDRAVIENPHKFDLGWLRSDLTDMPQRLVQVLADRRPSWLASWLEKEWRQEMPVPSWFVERGLIRCGAIPPNDDAAYFDRMTQDWRILYNDSARETDNLDVIFHTRKQLLESDPELFEHDVWRLFEVDSIAFRYTLTEWGAALVELSQEGKLDRSRLLAQSLEGMLLPLAPTTLNGLGKFHEMLSPTIEERAQLIDSYLQLLASSNSTVVGHALGGLETLHKAKKLDADAYFTALPGALLIDKKAQPIKAMKLAAKLLKEKNFSGSRTTAAGALTPAIQHANPDVQQEAVALLESLKDSIALELADELSQLADAVAVPLRPRFGELLKSLKAAPDVQSPSGSSKATRARPKGASPATVASSTSEPEPTNRPASEEYIGRAEALPESLRRASGVDAALQALTSDAPPAILPIEQHVIPRRDPSRAVIPIASLDELIATVSAVIERVEHVMNLERILDGISRFHKEQPDDFEQRVAALRQRLTKRAERGEMGRFSGADHELMQLIHTWLQLPALPPSESVHWYRMRAWFLNARIDAICGHIRESRWKVHPRHTTPMPLLSLPTHQGGWIDPMVLVERLEKHYVEHSEHPCYFDLAQAMLRLAPDGRAEALQRLSEPSYYNGDTLLRYALGDDCQLKESGGWGIEVAMIAAVRARAVSLGDSECQPGLPIAKAFFDENEAVHVTGAMMDDPTVPFSLAEVAFSYQPFIVKAFDPHDRQWWVEAWEAMTNPMDTVASCMAGHMAHLMDPEATWTYEACRLAVVASSNDRNETRVYATDALIESIARALVIPARLGRALAKCMNQIVLSRTLNVLKQVAQASHLHHWVVLEALDTCIVQLSEMPKDLHFILGQMLESAMVLEAASSAKACEKLKPLTGKTKTGKLATELLKLSASSAWKRRIDELICSAALERAERWQAITAAHAVDGVAQPL